MRGRTLDPRNFRRRKDGRSLRPRIEAMERRWLPAPLLTGHGVTIVRPAAQVATTTTITSGVNPATPPNDVTFTVTVAGPTGGTTAPTGTVSLGGITGLPPVPLTPGQGANAGTGTATFVVSTDPFTTMGQPARINLPPGQYPIQAAYSGDANDAASTSATLTQTVAKIPTGLGFMPATAAPALPGQPVTFTVIAAPGITNSNATGPAPTGPVNLFDNGVAVGSGALVPAVQPAVGGINSTVGFTLRDLPAGLNTITATYPGDAAYVATGPATLVLHVVAPTTTTLAIAPNPVALGQPTIVGVTVAGAAGGAVPTGLITYVASSNVRDSGNNSGVILSGFGTLDAAGRVAIGLLPPTTGTYRVTVNYLGDGNSATSFATVETLRVLLPTATALSASPARSTAGHPVTFTAIVAGITGGTPTGTVTFRDGSRTLGTAPLDAAGRATLTTAALAPGNHAITAFFNGNAQFAASPPGAVTQVVSPVTPPAPTGDGPRITGVRRFGIHGRQTLIVLAFNGPLNLFAAQDIANYVLTGPAPSNQLIPITSAVYSPLDHTVTLHTARRLDAHPRFRYTLRVNGSTPIGVADPSGRRLDGAGTGRAGSDYATIIAGL